MSFHETRLPARLGFGTTGGVERRTEIVTLASGFEQRSTPWAQERRRYLIGAGIRSLDDAAALVAFFEAPRGGCMASDSRTSATSSPARRRGRRRRGINCSASGMERGRRFRW